MDVPVCARSAAARAGLPRAQTPATRCSQVQLRLPPDLLHRHQRHVPVDRAQERGQMIVVAAPVVVHVRGNQMLGRDLEPPGPRPKSSRYPPRRFEVPSRGHELPGVEARKTRRRPTRGREPAEPARNAAPRGPALPAASREHHGGGGAMQREVGPRTAARPRRQSRATTPAPSPRRTEAQERRGGAGPTARRRSHRRRIG